MVEGGKNTDARKKKLMEVRLVAPHGQLFRQLVLGGVPQSLVLRPSLNFEKQCARTGPIS